MTYCVGLFLKDGLVLLSDTRTNAGLDHISSFSKMHVVEQPGERMLALLTAGNLAITQAVWNRVQEGFPLGEEVHTLRDVPSMFRAAQLVGAAVRDVFETDGPAMKAQSVAFEASFLLGGQIAGGPMRLFLIYAAGNFIEATADTPFLQVGEHKYGKPILDRVVQPALPLYEAVKCALVSFDSTIKSNLSVGLPIDLALVRRDQFAVAMRHRIDADDAYFRQLRTDWSQGLRRVFNELPEPGWLR